MRWWAGFVGIIILLGLGVVAIPFWMKFASENEDAANAVVGGINFINLIVLIMVLVVYWRQANIMERQENLQRAWVIAGMGEVHFNAINPVTGFLRSGPNGRPIVFCNPGYHNYGQTPAFARYLQWGFCSDSPPAKPNWSACTKTPINDWVDTSERERPIPVQPSHEMTEATVIFYGRLAYFDVFQRERYSGFIYRWRIDCTHERLGDKYPKYVKWA